MRLGWLFVLALSMLGCERGPVLVVSDSSFLDSPPGCHYDCLGQLACYQGKARAELLDAVPCGQWTGSCPGASLTCASGCELQFATIPSGVHAPSAWSARVDVFCAETPSARLGDPCDRGCVPTRAGVDGQGQVVQQYLTCDASTATCVAGLAPVIDRYLQPCPMTAQSRGGPGVAGVVWTNSDYADRACLLAWDAGTQAMRSGATIDCVGDWECPAGSTCDDSVPCLDISGVVLAICRPGPRGAALIDHLP